MACVASTAALQPEIVPSSVAKINWLGPEAPPSRTTKSLVPLKTTPVGAAVAPGVLVGGGMVIVGGTDLPLFVYCVDTPVPLSETRQGPVGLCASPQALTRLGSVKRARPGTSETRFLWW